MTCTAILKHSRNFVNKWTSEVLYGVTNILVNYVELTRAYDKWECAGYGHRQIRTVARIPEWKLKCKYEGKGLRPYTHQPPVPLEKAIRLGISTSPMYGKERLERKGWCSTGYTRKGLKYIYVNDIDASEVEIINNTVHPHTSSFILNNVW